MKNFSSHHDDEEVPTNKPKPEPMSDRHKNRLHMQQIVNPGWQEKPGDQEAQTSSDSFEKFTKRHPGHTPHKGLERE